MNLDSDSEEEDEVLGGVVPEVEKAAEVASGNGAAELAAPIEKTTRMVAAEAAIDRNEWDVSSWEALFTEAMALPNIQHAREYYEQFVQKFPTAGRYWKFYAEHEAKLGNTQEAQAVIQRGLAESLGTELFRYYIEFVQATAQATLAAVPTDATAEVKEEAQERARADVERAYEHTLDQLSFSFDARSIWTQYIEFLKEMPQDDHFQAGQRVSKLRSAYRRALSSPVENMEGLWQEYEAFEKGGANEVLAVRLVKEIASVAMANRDMARELGPLYSKIRPHLLAVPAEHGGKDIEDQVQAWRKILEWEISHSSEVKAAQRKARVRFAYKRCLCVLRYFPTIWYEFAAYERSSGEMDAAAAVLQLGTKALPGNLMLNFAQCDFFEQAKRVDEAEKLYLTLQKASKKPLVWIQYQWFALRTNGMKGARKAFAKARKAKDGSCSWHVYAAAANLEFYANKEPTVARNIFELGLKRFGTEVDFVMTYIDFLSAINDDNQLRTLFNRVISNFEDREKALPLWRAFLEMELRRSRGGGNLQDVAKLERRRRDAFPDDPSLVGINGQSWRYQMFGLFADESSRASAEATAPNVAELMALARAQKNEEDMKMVVPAFLAPLCAGLPRNVYSVTAESDVEHVMATFISMSMPAPPPGYKEEEKEGNKDGGNNAGESEESDEPGKKRKRVS